MRPVDQHVQAVPQLVQIEKLCWAVSMLKSVSPVSGRSLPVLPQSECPKSYCETKGETQRQREPYATDHETAR